MKGRAVQVEHYLYDELWNMGNKKIPQGIEIIKKKEDIIEEVNVSEVTSPNNEEEKMEDN